LLVKKSVKIQVKKPALGRKSLGLPLTRGTANTPGFDEDLVLTLGCGNRVGMLDKTLEETGRW
jgi:hypothetical protein